jgi:L-amino acid N-acyltransferase YncA
MEFGIRRVRESDGSKVIGIFNHYAEHSFAAYPDEAVTIDFFDALREMMCGTSFYVVEKDRKDIVGFGLLREYHRSTVFCRAAELTYFIIPDCQRRGLGTTLLGLLASDARKMKIITLLASISSLNEKSIAFHTKNGFSECGRLKQVGMKFGKEFDIVWMQKHI